MKLRQLKIIRNQNGLTQQQIADVLDISRSAYCGYETGRRSPDIDTLSKLSEFYHIPIDRFVEKIVTQYIYDDEFVESQPEARYLAQLSKEETDLIVNLRIADKESRNEILKFAREKCGRKSL